MHFYIYAYLRINGTPYYIGKGSGKRAWARNHTVPLPSPDRIVILESNLTEVGALALERRLIRWWGRKDMGTGILRNMTDGGDGVAGRKLSSSTKQKISVKRTGAKFTASHKAAMSKARKGRPIQRKLTAQQILQIREDLATKKYTRKEVSAMLNITYETVKSIALARGSYAFR